eukprot:SAG31_NODE_10972_length_1077_cov_1.337423_1_plen_237_part_01
MLKVEVGKGRFYVSRHDAKPSSGAEHDGRSAGMVREEGSVHRHSQQLLLSLPACASSPHARRVLSTGALTSHARQQLPATPARGQSAFSSCTTTPLRPADAHAAGKGMPKRGRRLTTQARSTGRRRSWRCLRAPAALSLHAAPAAHQSGHARLHPDAISAAPRSPPPPLSCERRGAPPSSRASWPCPPVTRRGDGGTWALRAMNPLIRTPLYSRLHENRKSWLDPIMKIPSKRAPKE